MVVNVVFSDIQARPQVSLLLPLHSRRIHIEILLTENGGEEIV